MRKNTSSSPLATLVVVGSRVTRKPDGPWGECRLALVDPSLPRLPLESVSPAGLQVSRTQRQEVLSLQPGRVPKAESQATWRKLGTPFCKMVRFESTVWVTLRWCSTCCQVADCRPSK